MILSLVICQVKVQHMQCLMFMLRQLHQKYRENGKKVYFGFVDSEKAQGLQSLV